MKTINDHHNDSPVKIAQNSKQNNNCCKSLFLTLRRPCWH